MPKTVEFIFDFASPNVYLVHKVLPPITQRTGAEVKLFPCFLGGMFRETNNQPPMLSMQNVKGKLAYERLEFTRFIKKHQLTKFVFNPHFPVNTITLMRGALVAQRDGFLPAYVEAGLKAMWEDGQNMSDPGVFVAVMDKAGLHGAKILEATADPQIKAQLAANTTAAIERGCFGMPTLFIGSEMFFGKERLGQLEEELLR